jgi:serine/threonine-protein kinase HipA
MGRTRTHPRLSVYQNGKIVGYLSKQPNGAIEFIYAEEWLSYEYANPVSLSLPLRDDAFKGAPVIAVFENLLPDVNDIRQRVAERVGADGVDAYSLLSKIGRDCIGALQFFPEDVDVDFSDLNNICGEVVNEDEIENILNNLARAPLGLNQDNDFRISIAGAQEKTAFLYHKEKWFRPLGTTPTTHIFKTEMGHVNGIDLSDSVENEFYGLMVIDAFGLPVNKAEIKIFGNTKALVVERFDRRWNKDNILHRIPQEDFCQALSIPPGRKYQNELRPPNERQPSMVEILKLLKGSDQPIEDQKLFLKAQIIFWLMGATDGHAKNFSIFLRSGGSFSLTPFYDILTVQPYYDAKQVEQKKFKLAMSVGNNNHYQIDEIQGRHFIQTVEKAGLPRYIAEEAIGEILFTSEQALAKIEESLPHDFPENIHHSVSRAMKERLKHLT